MKVKELIDQLQKLDPNLLVLAAWEDEGEVVSGYSVRPFEVAEVTVTSIKMDRDDEGRRTICAVAAGEGQKFAIIDITAIF